MKKQALSAVGAELPYLFHDIVIPCAVEAAKKRNAVGVAEYNIDFVEMPHSSRIKPVTE